MVKSGQVLKLEIYQKYYFYKLLEDRNSKTDYNFTPVPEHQNIEYKSSWHDDYLKWICGFANAQGGTIYIGKDDAGAVVGVEDNKI